MSSSRYPFVDAFVQPAGSPIRELFPYLSLPGMISFAGGYPAANLFDREGLAAASQRVFDRGDGEGDASACLQYGPTDGLPALKTQLMALMQRRGVGDAICRAETMLVTSGSQQGLDLLLRVLIGAGDLVLVEQPAYPATLQALRLQQADVVSVPVDEAGLDVEALARMLADGSLSKSPKLLYTVPTFANPTGLTLTRERRIALLQLAVQYRFLVVEDDPYGELRFADEPVPSLLSLTNGVPGSRDWVVYFGSLSKIVAPGLRVGWTVGPEEIIRRCLIAKQTADLCGSSWMQSVAAAYLADGALERHLPTLCAAYGEKCTTLCDALTEAFGAHIVFHRPAGGLFVWARLQSSIDAATLLTSAIDERVMFVPGAAFYADNVDPAGLRLSFAAPPVQDIAEGVSRLQRALRRAEDAACH